MHGASLSMQPTLLTSSSATLQGRLLHIAAEYLRLAYNVDFLDFTHFAITKHDFAFAEEEKTAKCPIF
jgi:hypothetical protein